MKAFSTVKKSLLAVVAACGAMSAAHATPVIGTAQLSNFPQVLITCVVSSCSTTGNVDWNPPVNPPPNTSPTFGNYSTAGAVNTGSFALPAFSGVTGGTVEDMSAVSTDANYMPVGGQPGGGKVGFLTFAAEPGWIFTATVVEAGSIPGTPYLLQQQGNSTEAQITVMGTICDASGSGDVCVAGDALSDFTVTFSTTFAGQSISDLETQLLSTGSLNNNVWSGTLIATAIPEPTSIALVGLGLAGAGFFARRRKA